MFKNATAQTTLPQNDEPETAEILELKLADRVRDVDEAQRPAAVRPVDDEPELPLATVIAKEISITGSLVSEGDIAISGLVHGDINCRKLVVRETARIKGNIIADEVIINGALSGPIRASRVKLQARARVESDIIYEFLVMDKGAEFEGSSRHTANPKAAREAPRTPPVTEQAQRPAPQPQSRPALVAGQPPVRPPIQLAV